MHFRFRLSLFFLLFFGTSYAVGVKDEDIQSLRDWISSKRMITVREMGGQLSISGNVHAEMQSCTAVRNGIAQRGRGTGFPNNLFDVEFNLLVDYRTDNTWLAARLRFDNDAGSFNDLFGTGTDNRMKVDRAYWGYRVMDSNRHTMDVNVGRIGVISSFFDSRIEFGSNFDGVSFKDAYAIDNVGDLYYQLGIFIVNEKKTQFAYLGEAGILNIANTGFYTKYSIINWDTKEMDKIPPQFDFIVSQTLFAYKWIPQRLDRPVVIYSAALYNHRARPLSVTGYKRANWGGYLGFSIGALKLAGDWAFDANYQVLQAQCVPDFDVQGVGLRSTGGVNFYYTRRAGKLTLNTQSIAEGNVNYRGFELTAQYLISNNLNLWQGWRQSITLDKSIGPFRKYKQYEVDFIYSF